MSKRINLFIISLFACFSLQSTFGQVALSLTETSAFINSIRTVIGVHVGSQAIQAIYENGRWELETSSISLRIPSVDQAELEARLNDFQAQWSIIYTMKEKMGTITVSEAESLKISLECLLGKLDYVNGITIVKILHPSELIHEKEVQQVKSINWECPSPKKPQCFDLSEGVNDALDECDFVSLDPKDVQWCWFDSFDKGKGVHIGMKDGRIFELKDKKQPTLPGFRKQLYIDYFKECFVEIQSRNTNRTLILPIRNVEYIPILHNKNIKLKIVVAWYEKDKKTIFEMVTTPTKSKRQEIIDKKSKENICCN